MSFTTCEVHGEDFNDSWLGVESQVSSSGIAVPSLWNSIQDNKFIVEVGIIITTAS